MASRERLADRTLDSPDLCRRGETDESQRRRRRRRGRSSSRSSRSPPNTRNGRRPSFTSRRRRSRRRRCTRYSSNGIRQTTGQRVATGRFGADMQVALVNDGPVTFLLEQYERRRSRGVSHGVRSSVELPACVRSASARRRRRPRTAATSDASIDLRDHVRAGVSIMPTTKHPTIT